MQKFGSLWSSFVGFLSENKLKHPLKILQIFMHNYCLLAEFNISIKKKPTTKDCAKVMAHFIFNVLFFS